jgi:hypothetical protein
MFRCFVSILLLSGAILGCGSKDAPAQQAPTPASTVSTTPPKKTEVQDAFCAKWTKLYCRDDFRCDPNLTDASLADCQKLYQPLCEHGLSKLGYDTSVGTFPGDQAAADACFAAAESFDCSVSLWSFFGSTCANVFSPKGGQLGGDCYGNDDCSDGLVCDNAPDSIIPSCHGKCVTSVGDGGSCETARCAAGLRCATGLDSRGMSTKVCAPDLSGTTPDAGTGADAGSTRCQPWETWVDAAGKCIARSLPGEACGGTYGISCLGPYRCSSGACVRMPGDGEACVDAFSKWDRCAWGATCYDMTGGRYACEFGDAVDCTAPKMMLYR